MHLLSSTACDQLWLLEISSDREPFPSLGCRRPCVSTSCLCLEPYQPPCEQAQHCAYSICNARWRAERAGLAGQTAFPALVTSPMFPPPCGYPSCVPTPTWLPVLCSHPCPVTSPVFSSTPSYQSPVPTSLRNSSESVGVRIRSCFGLCVSKVLQMLNKTGSQSTQFATC